MSLHNLFASNPTGKTGDTADYIINLNLPNWKTPTPTETPQKTTNNNQLYWMAGILGVIIIGIFALRKSK